MSGTGREVGELLSWLLAAVDEGRYVVGEHASDRM